MPRPLVSIMIPTYNQVEYLGEAIESALDQTYTPLEIVISDDASPNPDVITILDRYKNDPRISVYINRENLGRAKNYRTTLYERASGSWVINLDGDDFFYDSGFIERAMALVAGNPDVVMVTGRRLQRVEENQEFIENDRNQGPERVMSSEQAYQALLDEKYYYWHATTLYQRKIATGLDFYRYGMTATDDDSFLRLMGCGSVGVVPVWAAVWRKHASNASCNQSVREMIDNLRALEAPKDLLDHPLSKVCPEFLTPWIRKHLANRVKPKVRELLKDRRSLSDYFLFVWAVMKISPSVGGMILFRPKNVLRVFRAPFVELYCRMEKKCS